MNGAANKYTMLNDAARHRHTDSLCLFWINEIQVKLSGGKQQLKTNEHCALLGEAKDWLLLVFSIQ